MNYETSVSAETAERYGMATAVDRTGRTGNSRLWLIVLAFLGAVLGVGAWLYFSAAGAADDGDGREDQAPVISVISPGAATVEGEISATGTLSARRELPVGIAGEGGRVVSVPVDAGSWVRAGQVLAVIDRSVQNQQAASARAQIDVARADASLAQSNLDRALQLVDRGFISKADVDRLTATRDAAAARVTVARAQANELQARNARLNVVAPAAGLVLERSVEPGQVVSGGSGPLFRIARGGEMELNAQLSETDLARISTGVSATVLPAGTEKRFTGQIWQIAPIIDAQNRQGVARISLPYAAELRPGGFATAIISSGTVVAPVLPESAILSDAQGSYVYIIGPDNTAQRRAVETGMVTSEGVTIASGLSGTEQVVLRAGGFLTEGETVKPRRQKQ